MILTIDVGNTSTTCGLFDGDKIVLQFRRETNIHSSSDEIGIFFRTVLKENGYDWKEITRVGVCSVVPSVNYSLSSACTKYLNQDPLFIQAGIKTGLKLKYSNPKEIGADLIAAAMGAVHLFPNKDLIIADLGTATTLELVSKDTEFLGGSILPGLKISMDALATGTAKLPMVEIKKPEGLLGASTTEAIQVGLYYGNAGAIKEICYIYQKNVFHGQKPLIIATGGFAKIFADYSLFDQIVPELVLTGVKCAIDMN
ncbi:MAG: type III pantothenate kinase [Treponema sp.]|nr:type III pantothenate kinase [Treponema sp.]